MNVSVLFVLLATVFMAVVSAFPTTDDIVQYQIQVSEIDPIHTTDDPQEITGGRFQRATCDLLSVSTPIGSLNHAACAAHCLAMGKGYRGGRCRDGVCHCRR